MASCMYVVLRAHEVNAIQSKGRVALDLKTRITNYGIQIK